MRKGEHGTKVYFVKQLQVRDRSEPEGSDDAVRMVPMMKEYTVFNVAQCEGLPERILTPEAKAPRNKDQRDGLADEFLATTQADIREGMVKRTTSRVRTSSPCLRSQRSRMPIASMALPSMSLGIGQERRLGLIVTKG